MPTTLLTLVRATLLSIVLMAATLVFAEALVVSALIPRTLCRFGLTKDGRKGRY